MCCMVSVVTFAVHAQFQLGPKVGLNIANCAFIFEDDDDEPETNIMRLAYAFGVAADYGFSDAFSLQSGLIFTSKGYSYDLDEISEEIDYDGYERVIFNYIELPVNAVYKIKGFQIYAGPYIAFGICGKYKWDYTYDYYGTEEGDSGKMKLKPKFGEVDEDDLGEDEDAFYALDGGFNFGIGYQFDGFVIQAGYSLGLGNIMPKYTDDIRDEYKYSNRVITLSVAYMFNLGD